MFFVGPSHLCLRPVKIKIAMKWKLLLNCLRERQGTFLDLPHDSRGFAIVHLNYKYHGANLFQE